jgi:Rod binding domain-containing protein
MNVPATHSRIEASQLPLESLAGNKNVSDADKVEEVARQFEAVLLRQILQDIRKSVLAPAEGDPTATGIYSDMINNQLADSISRSGGFGLAKSVAAQLTHQVLPHAPAPLEASHATGQTAPTHKRSRGNASDLGGRDAALRRPVGTARRPYLLIPPQK